MKPHCLFVPFVLAMIVGCGNSKYIPPQPVDPEVLRSEQEKLDKMIKTSGEQRVGKYDPNAPDAEQLKINQMMKESGEERPGMPPAKAPAKSK